MTNTTETDPLAGLRSDTALGLVAAYLRNDAIDCDDHRRKRSANKGSSSDQ